MSATQWRTMCHYAAQADIDGHTWVVDNHVVGTIRRDGEVLYRGNEHDSLDMLKGEVEALSRGR